MKTQMIILFLITVMFGSLGAQEAYRPLPNEWGAGLRVKGFGALKDAEFQQAFEFPTLQLRYHRSEVLTFRLDFGIEGNGKKDVVRDSIFAFPGGLSGREQTSSSRQYGFSLSPGLEYHFEGTNQLDPYVGAQILFRSLGKEKLTSETEIGGGQNAFVSTQETLNPGELDLGLGLFLGFNYYLTSRFALGVEYSLGFVSKRTGGKATSTSNTTTTTNGTVVTSDSMSESFIRSRETELKNHGVLSLNLVYFFGAL